MYLMLRLLKNFVEEVSCLALTFSMTIAEVQTIPFSGNLMTSPFSILEQGRIQVFGLRFAVTSNDI